MKYITLEAGETVDGKKVTIASQEKFPIAENTNDIMEMPTIDNGWNEEEIVACFNYGSRVKRQTQLRAGVATPTNVKLFKSISAAEQEAMLRKHGVLK